MKIYEAIMKAADWIEKHPSMFQYISTDVPSCNTPGCAVGWIAHFREMPAQHGDVTRDVCKSALETSYWDGFVPRMDGFGFGTHGWRHDAKECADTLRKYAVKYHFPAKTGIPDSVRSLFRERATSTSLPVTEPKCLYWRPDTPPKGKDLSSATETEN